MSNTIRIKKGLDIPLAGVPSGPIQTDNNTTLFAIVPDDFPGYVWKVVVKAGDSVKAGDPLLSAKDCESLFLTSPVSGIVKEIKRGERRKIEFVSVESDGNNRQVEFGPMDSKETKLDALYRSGLFAMIRQRPFAIVPFAQTVPRDIFVTTFDTAPLAPPVISAEDLPMLETGLKELKEFTEGKVYLSVPKGSEIQSKYAEIYEFDGPHPAGNVGTQIAAIRPVNKGETVWTMDARTAARIGKLLSTGELDYTATVALCGPDMIHPHYVTTRIGASLSTLLKGQLKDVGGAGESRNSSGEQSNIEDIRVISGNVLTGVKENPLTGFLRYPYRQITAIDEGSHADEFMGWATMNPKKYSVKRTFPAFLSGLSKPFTFDSRIKGGHRAMILSGEYDKVFPMDIYPEYLIKAIIAKDIERMEQLGIYEVAPEDFALPEFVDTSKLELQKIVRDGLDYLRKETM